MINILNPDGTYQRERRRLRRARPLQGVRKRVVADLEALGLLVEGRADRDIALKLHRPQQDADRAVPVRPVVREDGRRRRQPGFAQLAMDAVTVGPGEDPPRALRQELSRLARREARLVHQPATLVGPPHPDLVLRRLHRGRAASAPSAAATTSPGSRGRGGRLADLRRDRPRPPTRLGAGHRAGRRTPTSSTPGSARPSGRTRRSAGPSRRPSWPSITRPASFDGPRHHHALGGPDGDLRPVQHGRRPVPRRLHPPGDPGRQRQADVEVGRQRHRPGRHHRPLRRRCPAVHPGRLAHRDPGPAHARREGQARPTAARSTPPSGSSRGGPSRTSSGTPPGSP